MLLNNNKIQIKHHIHHNSKAENQYDFFLKKIILSFIKGTLK